MGIGVQIKRAMEANGRSAADVAKAMGITESAVSQWFAKDSGPKRSRLLDLADYLNAPIPWLLSDEPWPPGSIGVSIPNPTVEAPAMQIVPVQTIPGRPDIPVWSAVAAGDEQGTMIMSSEPIDWISRSDTECLHTCRSRAL